MVIEGIGLTAVGVEKGMPGLDIGIDCAALGIMADGIPVGDIMVVADWGDIKLAWNIIVCRRTRVYTHTQRKKCKDQ